MGFYNEKYVGTKAINSKTCSWCGKEIPKGEPHYVLMHMESYCQYPIHCECHSKADKKCDGDMDKFLNHLYKK